MHAHSILTTVVVFTAIAYGSQAHTRNELNDLATGSLRDESSNIFPQADCDLNDPNKVSKCSEEQLAGMTGSQRARRRTLGIVRRKGKRAQPRGSAVSIEEPDCEIKVCDISPCSTTEKKDKDINICLTDDLVE